MENEGSYEARMSGLPEAREAAGSAERRRRWSADDKLAIVRETLVPGAVAQAVADRHGISTGLLYTWRKQMLRVAMTGFAAVQVTPAVPSMLQVTDSSEPVSTQESQGSLRTSVVAASARPALIEIELPTGTKLRVGADVDGPALRCVLTALAASAS
jgi:transposase